MRFFKSDFYVVAPGTHYPKLFLSGEVCPDNLLDLAKSADKLEPESKVERAAKKIIKAASKVKAK